MSQVSPLFKKASTITALAVISSAMLLAGCGSNSASTASNASDTKPGEKVVLNMWFWSGAGFDKDQLIPEFNRTHPNIEIKPQIYKWDDAHKKLLTAFSAGSGAPDIAMIDVAQMEGFMKYPDKFYDLNSLGTDKVKSDYLDWKWKQGTSKDGKQIGLPTDIGPTVMYYRQDIFKQAGLPYEPDDVSAKIKTWDDFLNAGVQIKQKTGKKMLANPMDIWGQIRDQGDQLYFDDNDKLVLDTNPQIKKAFTYFKKARDLGIAGALDSKNHKEEYAAAENKGDFAVVLSAAWAKGQIETNAPDTKGLWRAALMPEGTGNQGGSFLTIPKESKHAKEAWEAISWLLSPQQQLAVFKNEGNFPSTPSVYNDPAIKEKGYDFWGGQKLGVLFSEAAKNVKVARKGTNYQVADDVIRDTFMDLAANPSKDADAAWKTILDKVNTQLKHQ